MQKKYITIVFDDGPRVPMREIIDKFIKYGFKCGFAIIGNQIKDDGIEILRYAIDNGFEFVSHSENHFDLRTLSLDGIENELMSPINKVKELFGYKIQMARLPYLALDDKVSAVAKRLKLYLLGRSMKTAADWNPAVTSKEIADSVIDTVHDGAVACMHVTQSTLVALDTILPTLKDMGYELLNPSDLFKVKGIKELPLGVNIDRCDTVF